jgi:peptide/nickel transport system substrate-binding protein
MIRQQWKAIGIDADIKLLERSLFYSRTRLDQNQAAISSNGGSESLFLFTIAALPVDPSTSLNGAGHALWYTTNGAQGIAPTDEAELRAYALYRSAAGLPEAERTKVAQEIWKIAADQVWSIGLVGQSPAYMGTRVVNARLENVPERTCTSQHCRTPWSGHPEQWFYK